MARYRNIEPQAMNEIEVIDHTEVSAEAVLQQKQNNLMKESLGALLSEFVGSKSIDNQS